MGETPRVGARPFERKYLEGEEPREQKIVKVRLNREEEDQVRDLMLVFNTPYASTALKKAAAVCLCVVGQHFSSEVLDWMTSPRRRRLGKGERPEL